MEQIILAATRREQLGTPAARRLRRSGQIPAVVYGRGQESLSVSVNPRDLQRAFQTKAGTNVIITLKIGGAQETKRAEERTVIVKDLQYDAVQSHLLHIDFNQISLRERIQVNVPLLLKGESVGVKQDGGLLEQFLRELSVECLPTDIPPHLDVEISALKIGDALHVSDVAAPPQVKVLTDAATVVLSVLPPHVEKAPEAAAAEVAPAEPELIRKKKAEEGEEAAPAEGAKAEAKPEKAEAKKEGK